MVYVLLFKPHYLSMSMPPYIGACVFLIVVIFYMHYMVDNYNSLELQCIHIVGLVNPACVYQDTLEAVTNRHLIQKTMMYPTQDYH